MAGRDLYEHLHLIWNAENDYAETLRSRRNSYGAALVVVAGIGAYRIEPFVSEGDTFAVANDGVRAFITLLLFLALLCFAIGAFLLYTSGRPSEPERELIGEATAAEVSEFGLRRASEFWHLTTGETDLLAGDIEHEEFKDPVWQVRCAAMTRSIRFLGFGNRRVSRRIRRAGAWLGGGLLLVGLSIVTHSVAVNTGDFDVALHNGSGEATGVGSADDGRREESVEGTPRTNPPHDGEQKALPAKGRVF